MTTFAKDLDDTDDLRRRFVERFETWLDDLLSRPEPALGIAADLLAELESTTTDGNEEVEFQMDGEGGQMDGEGGDLFSLWSAVQALTREVQKQGALLHQLVEGTAPPAQATRNDDDDARLLEPVEEADPPILRQLILRRQSLHRSALRALRGDDPLQAQGLLARAQRLRETDTGRRLGLLIEWWLATEPRKVS